jgi:hypothetical protein
MPKDLTTSEIDRQNILNNPYALAEIEKAAGIQGIPFEGRTVLLKEQVASFFEVTVRTVENYLENHTQELARNGYAVLVGKRLKDMKLAIQASDVPEADFENIKKAPQLGIFDFRAFLNLQFACVIQPPTKKCVNRVDASFSRCLLPVSRPAGPLLSFGRVKHTSAGIFLPQKRTQPAEVAA